MWFIGLVVVVMAYLIGSLSAALIVSQKMGMPDPRSYGSGNPGATNMLRSGRKDAATLTLLGDALKGVIAVVLARCLASWLHLGDGVVAWAAIAVVIGHMYPLFFNFKGGKGVATALGVLLAMSFTTTLWIVAIWAVIAFKFKKSSLAALVAAAATPFAAFIIIYHPSWGWALTLISALVIYRHRSNIGRMQSGNESNIGETVVQAASEPVAAAENTAVKPVEAETPATQVETVKAEAVQVETVKEVVQETQAVEPEKAEAEVAQEAESEAKATETETAPSAEVVAKPKAKRGSKKSSE
ncbi:glycerol-3-phosphate 1-O-acyltransferase PlsY [Kingella kingae]|nr:glycerol-3-phosphate 1-O-acyltransferase PlsY [Kingella kingae]MDK4566929.1 glycerol-3-phosphate 1-O-acyltransferase PlsY [Kingella kingae]MDK4636505.1 glycerol-3-phosphate 1-O-acyltransferase PlsY [Kingella kingae]MDK4672133.1 glycerol-3-phosphate 1-O-acyltransferase PlsY [Kingella kingae]MDK4695297.1 glycerol-3-phosphate 1-O-acyltransferase PlsY [Kingella kingae]